jgi:hypothetical protein
MAICPNCHTPDKNFFAPACHACNEQIPLIQQIIVSLIFLSVKAVFVIAMLWFLFVYLPG